MGRVCCKTVRTTKGTELFTPEFAKDGRKAVHTYGRIQYDGRLRLCSLSLP